MTHRNFHFHLYHYLLLIFIIMLGTVLFSLNAGNPQLQYRIVIFTSGLYFLWGVVHHRLEGDLHPKIVVEYLLISVLAVVLLRGAIF